jgi:hypothetical protein
LIKTPTESLSTTPMRFKSPDAYSFDTEHSPLSYPPRSPTYLLSAISSRLCSRGTRHRGRSPTPQRAPHPKPCCSRNRRRYSPTNWKHATIHPTHEPILRRQRHRGLHSPNPRASIRSGSRPHDRIDTRRRSTTTTTLPILLQRRTNTPRIRHASRIHLDNYTLPFPRNTPHRLVRRTRTSGDAIQTRGARTVQDSISWVAKHHQGDAH